MLGDDQGQAQIISLSCVQTITKGTALLSIVYPAFKVVRDVIGLERYIRETILLPSVGGVQLEESFIPLTHPYVACYRGERRRATIRIERQQVLATRNLFISEKKTDVISENSNTDAAQSPEIDLRLDSCLEKRNETRISTQAL